MPKSQETPINAFIGARSLPKSDISLNKWKSQKFSSESENQVGIRRTNFTKLGVHDLFRSRFRQGKPSPSFSEYQLGAQLTKAIWWFWFSARKKRAQHLSPGWGTSQPLLSTSIFPKSYDSVCQQLEGANEAGLLGRSYLNFTFSPLA